MFRDCGQGKGKRLGQVTNGRLAPSQTVKDGAAGGIAKRVEDAIEIMFNHTVDYTRLPLIVNPSVKYFRSSNWEDSSRFPGVAKEPRSRGMRSTATSGSYGASASPTWRLSTHSGPLTSERSAASTREAPHPELQTLFACLDRRALGAGRSIGVPTSPLVADARARVEASRVRHSGESAFFSAPSSAD